MPRSFVRRLVSSAIAAIVAISGVGAVSPSASADGWDFVYGDPGPANYSRYQTVRTGTGGEAYLAGFFTGSFHGLTATDVYRPFVQRIDANGTIAWTVVPTSDTFTTIPPNPDLVRDGQGTVFFRNTDAGRGWAALSPSGTVVATTAAQTIDSAAGRPIAVSTGGILQVPFNNLGRVERRSGSLTPVWSFDTTGYFDSNVAPDLAESPDGSFWLVGTKSKTLPTGSDSVSMVHLSAAGQLISAIRHFGVITNVDRAWVLTNPILTVGPNFLWVNVMEVQPTTTQNSAFPYTKAIWSFDTTDGHKLGVVPSRVPYEQIPIGDKTFGCPNLDLTTAYPQSATSTQLFERRVVMQGSRLVLFAGCMPHTPGTTGDSAPAYDGSDITAMVLVYATDGPLGANLRRVSTRPIAAGLTVSSIDADDQGNVVIAGSTTAGLVYSGPIEANRRTEVAQERAVAVRNPTGNITDLPDLKPLTPARLFDTRPSEPNGAIIVAKQKVRPPEPLRIRVAGAAGVPTGGVAAVSLNVTAVSPDAAGFVTVYPCGARPGASNLNFVAGQTVPNAVIAPVSASGEICLFANVATDLVADVNGWFAAGSSFNSLTPTRLFDTRPGEDDGVISIPKVMIGGDREIRVRVTDLAGIPALGVGAVSLNVTATQPSGPGYITVYPCGTRPGASNLNFVTGQTVPNAVIAPVSANGEVCFFSNVATHVIADVNGWFSSVGSFHAVEPSRLFDTRPGEPHGTVTVTKQQYGGANELRVRVTGVSGVPESGAIAVSLNVTATAASGAGFVTVYPCGTRPGASNLNFVAGQTVPNAVIAPVSASGEICLFANSAVHLLADVNGWIAA